MITASNEVTGHHQNTMPFQSHESACMQESIQEFAHLRPTLDSDQSVADFTTHVLTSHWKMPADAYSETDGVPHTCRLCRQTLIRLVNQHDTQAVVKEIKDVGRQIIDNRETALRRYSRTQAQTQTQAQTRRHLHKSLQLVEAASDEKLILFLDHKVTTLFNRFDRAQMVTPDQELALGRALKKSFAGAIHVRCPRPFFSPEWIKSKPPFQPQVNADHGRTVMASQWREDGLRGIEVTAEFDWNVALDIQRQLRCGVEYFDPYGRC
jgi:hypothetical protein